MDRGILAKIEKIFKYMNERRLNRKEFLKTLAIFTGALMLLNKTEDAFAHPPSDINITYTPETKMLKAIITHNVSNPKAHYINKVNVKLNGQEIIAHKLSRQDNNTEQTVSYLIPEAKAQDIIALEAYCNISGVLEKEIKVG